MVPFGLRADSTSCVTSEAAFASVLWSSCLAMLAVGTNSTAIMVALPSMRTELVLSLTGVEWAVSVNSGGS